MTRLHVLDLGRLQLDRALLVAGSPGGQIAAPVSAYVVEHAAGRVLFDTGCHPDAMGPAGRWPAAFQSQYPWSGGPECHLPQRLAALGLAPGAFDTVVLSHLHSDHAGCVEWFRDARLIVHADELAAAWRGGPAYLPGDIQPWRGIDLHWHTLARDGGDLALSADVTVLNWGAGHAPGMLGLLVRTRRNGAILLASDAAYCGANLAPPYPRPGFLHDAAGYDATIRRIALLARDGAQVWCGHDAGQFATLRHGNGDWYD